MCVFGHLYLLHHHQQQYHHRHQHHHRHRHRHRHHCYGSWLKLLLGGQGLLPHLCHGDTHSICLSLRHLSHPMVLATVFEEEPLSWGVILHFISFLSPCFQFFFVAYLISGIYFLFATATSILCWTKWSEVAGRSVGWLKAISCQFLSR